MTEQPVLPVVAYREEIVRRLRSEQVLIVTGETGSGKTTQLCQYALEDGLLHGGLQVAISQPRRIAAIEAARRVAAERGGAVGGEVAHTVRFDDTSTASTRIRFITDGSLLREASESPTLARYALVIMDEAHERSVATDVLLGLLRRLLRSGARPDLRLVVASATLDVGRFAAFFGGCGHVAVPGRAFPVDIFHAAADGESGAPDAGLLVERAVELALRLHRTLPLGPDADFLIFLTGAAEIRLACATLDALANAPLDEADGGAAAAVARTMVIFPLHAGLSSDSQARAFARAPAGARKVVVATNVAETSLTIAGVRVVIDGGLAKVQGYDAARGMELLSVVPISKASARQRAGRAGRTRAGECYRLYSEAHFARHFSETSEPEITRTPLSTTALALKAMGVADLLAFELLDPPPRGALLRALLDLHAIAALDDAGGLTALGRRISRLPVEPRLGAALAAAERLGCVDEVATIAAMLSGEEPFARDGARAAGAAAGAADGRESVALARARLGARDVSARVDVYSSDHLFLLALDCAFAAALAAGAPAAQRWAADWGVLPRAMHAAREVRAQLIGLVARGRAAGAPSGTSDGHAEPLGARVRRAICAGYFAHAVRRVGAGGDVCVPLAPAAGAAGSALLHPLPQSACVLAGGHSLFVYHSLSAASGGVHMRNVCQVERDWLEPPLRRLRQPVDPLVLAGAQPALVATAPVGKRVRGGGPDGGAGGDGGCAAAAVGAARSDDARARADAARARFLKRRGVDDGTE